MVEYGTVRAFSPGKVGSSVLPSLHERSSIYYRPLRLAAHRNRTLLPLASGSAFRTSAGRSRARAEEPRIAQKATAACAAQPGAQRLMGLRLGKRRGSFAACDGAAHRVVRERQLPTFGVSVPQVPQEIQRPARQELPGLARAGGLINRRDLAFAASQSAADGWV
jgi:hypothetical protein